MIASTRRAFIAEFAVAAGLWSVIGARAVAGGVPKTLDKWAQSIADLNRELAAGRLTPTAWQDAIAVLDAGVDLGELARYLDFEKLTAAMTFPEKLAETADPHFPKRIHIAGIERPWFIRFFGMRKGGAIIPHVHNNMVSAHLVMSGSFHARTFDRAADIPDTRGDLVMLRPSLDRQIGPGEAITMSDERDNCHWLVAEEDRAFTFDVGVVGLSKTRSYALKANKYSMIYVDPTTEEDGYGLIKAPVLSFEESVAKFAA